ncbi:unnamed protein product [Vicia faba]|uniref:Uncharacterized protein n=1 Tax=Vicia faba TaxID=3906 RepID=A0AAV1A058_VICFA|nr:unnamed protein product [Vicia faba]
MASLFSSTLPQPRQFASKREKSLRNPEFFELLFRERESDGEKMQMLPCKNCIAHLLHDLFKQDDACHVKGYNMLVGELFVLIHVMHVTKKYGYFGEVRYQR